MAALQKSVHPQSHSKINPERTAESTQIAKQSILANSQTQINNFTIVPSNLQNPIASKNMPSIPIESQIKEESQFYPLKLQQSNPMQNNQFTPKPQDSHLTKSQIEERKKKQLQQYFQKCIKEVQTFNRFVKTTQGISNGIKQQITVGQLQVSNKRRHLNCKKDDYKWRVFEAKKKMVQIQKYEMIRKLKNIQHQEVILVHQSILHRNKSLQIKKSIYTKEQRQAISSILKKNYSFQKLLQQKTQQYIENKIINRQKQQEQLKKQQEHQNQIKKKEIQKRLKEMQLKSQERKQQLQQSIIKADKKYIHRELQRKYRSQQRQHQRQIEQKLKSISDKHKLNIDLINQHDKKYAENLQKRSKSMSLLPNHSVSRMKQSTYFSKIIEEEIFEAKQRNYQRLMKLKQHQYHSKILNYQQKIDKQFKPKVDPTKSIVILPRVVIDNSLSKQQRFEKGLEYLAVAKQLKKNQQDIIEPPKEIQNYGYKAYKDYLKHEQVTSVDATKKEFNQILSKTDEEKDFNSILRAKFLAEGLSAKCKKVGDDEMYYSAKTKLSLLSQLY